MANEDTLKKLEERLTRLEATLSQGQGGPGGFTAPGGAVVDPAPWPGGGWGGYHYPRWPWPHPIVDPVPWGPQTISDPAPWAGGGFAQPRQAFAASALGRIGHIGDPAPIDISRFSVSQLESSLHSINAEKARLTSMETMIKGQLEKLKKQG
jgi:hypothetical protein